jgi:D-alanyl-D-alanine carboxypeptidase
MASRLAAAVVLAALAVGGVVPASAVAAPDDLVDGVRIGDSSQAVQAAAPESGVPAGALSTAGGRELWSRAADQERAMASTTKIMTALLALEHAEPSDVVTVTMSAAAVGGSGVYLRAGEELTVEELLYAMMLESDNSAAHALAAHVAGSVDAFVAMMNERASELGLTKTSFRNPHGLDAEGHHSSAADLARLTRFAMLDEDFRRVVGTPEATISGPNGARTLVNSNLLLQSVDGANGVKTGWTTPAGYCLVATAQRGEVELVSVVLGSSSEMRRFEEAQSLLEWGFAHYRSETLVSEGETVGPVAVTPYLDRSVVAVVETDGEGSYFDLGDGLVREYELPVAVEAPVDAGEELGAVRVMEGDRVVTEVPLVAAEPVPAPGFFERAWIAVVRAWRDLTGGSETPQPAPAA